MVKAFKLLYHLFAKFFRYSFSVLPSKFLLAHFFNYFLLLYRFKLDFKFRTFDRNGIVVAMTDQNADRYLYAFQKNGQMIYAFNFDGIHREISGKNPSGHSFADGNWHRVNTLYNSFGININRR